MPEQAEESEQPAVTEQSAEDEPSDVTEQSAEDEQSDVHRQPAMFAPTSDDSIDAEVAPTEEMQALLTHWYTISEVNEAAGEVVIDVLNIIDPTVFFGILIGAAIPAVFSAMLILGVDKNAQRMVAEIHRQFNPIKGLREGTAGVSPE